MKKILITVLVVLGFVLVIGYQAETDQSKTNDETRQVMTLGFEDSGTPKSVEDDWGG